MQKKRGMAESAAGAAVGRRGSRTPHKSQRAETHGAPSHLTPLAQTAEGQAQKASSTKGQQRSRTARARRVRQQAEQHGPGRPEAAAHGPPRGPAAHSPRRRSYRSTFGSPLSSEPRRACRSSCGCAREGGGGGGGRDRDRGRGSDTGPRGTKPDTKRGLEEGGVEMFIPKPARSVRTTSRPQPACTGAKENKRSRRLRTDERTDGRTARAWRASIRRPRE